jgi:hypothetical protein
MSVDIGDFGGQWLRRSKRFILKSDWLHNALILVISYAGWSLLVHFLSLTFITYSVSNPNTRLQDINDVLYSNQVSLTGLGTFIFVILLWRLHPITSIQGSDIFRRERFENFFIPGFLRGASYSGFLLLSFIIFGFYRCLGYFIQMSAVSLDIANITFRMLALSLLAYSEEFLFHSKLVGYFKNHLPNWLSAQVIAIFYCCIKLLQFDLGIMHVITLYILSLNLFYRAQRSGNFEKGAGYWTACLIVFQPLASLPIFGNEFSGILIVKPSVEHFSDEVRLLTGGPGGPLSSLGFQLLLLLDLLRSMLRNRWSEKTKLD